MNAPTDKQYECYQLMFDFLNKELFGEKLASCLLVFSSRNPKVAGHFAESKWQRLGQKVHEININPSYLSKAEDIEIVATLTHEMVHLWQAQFGNSSKSGYHNKEWAKKMEIIGLMPSSNGLPDGDKTGFKMDHYVIKGGLFETVFNKMPESIFLPFRTEIKQTVQKRSKGKLKIKYTCPNCDTNLWGKPGLTPICGNCLSTMTSVEQPEQNVKSNSNMLEALKICTYYIQSTKGKIISKEEAIYGFAELLIREVLQDNEGVDFEIKQQLLYRLGEMLDHFREKGAVHDFIHGRYILN